MKTAIIGCGLIGQKRAKALGGAPLVACADAIPDRAAALARSAPECVAFNTWRQLLERSDVEVVIVSTTHDVLAEITLAAINSGKHVLVEKPAALNSRQLEPLIAAAREKSVLVRVGFNHRYHAALQKAREIFNTGALGPLMYIRGRYGHGGRIGYEKEWRAKKEMSGGGELIDQGVHLIDLSRWFLGDFTHVDGFVNTYFWPMQVEDNGFMLLRNDLNQLAFLHASCTEWKNLFSLEIFGRNGKLEINGLGGSYGTEKLTWYRMLPEMGPPETTAWEYPMIDKSWELEFAEFVEDIRLKRQPAAGLRDAQAALQVVEQLYENWEKSKKA